LKICGDAVNESTGCRRKRRTQVKHGTGGTKHARLEKTKGMLKCRLRCCAEERGEEQERSMARRYEMESAAEFSMVWKR
jgi:hypothetical protein